VPEDIGMGEGLAPKGRNPFRDADRTTRVTGNNRPHSSSPSGVGAKVGREDADQYNFKT